MKKFVKDSVFNESLFEKIVKQNLVISVKIDCASLVAVNHGGSELEFFGRGGNQSIDFYQRAAMDIYEESIDHLNQFKDHMEYGKRHFFEFYREGMPTIIKLKEPPLNNLVLLGIDGLRPDSQEVKEIAKKLRVTPPPIIFSGKLNRNQIDTLKEYMMSDGEEQSLREVLADIFKIDEVYNLSDDMEGIVIWFENDGDPSEFKIIDHQFKRRFDQADLGKAKIRPYRANLNFILWNKNQPWQELAQQAVDSEGDNLINFARLYSTHIDDKEGEHIHKSHVMNNATFPEFVRKSRFYQLNKKWLDDDLLRRSKEHWYFDDIFREIIMSLRKERKRRNFQIGLGSKELERIRVIRKKLMDER